MTGNNASTTPSKPETIAQEDWDAVDIPELTEEWFAKARHVGRPVNAVSKETATVRLDADVLAYFKATGPDWQTRINEALRRVAGL